MPIRTAFSWRGAMLTDTGRLRTNNEDAVALDLVHGLALLADGMGGYNAGEVASAMALSVIGDHFGRWRAAVAAASTGTRQALQSAVDRANAAIAEAGAADPAMRGLATTLVLAAWQAQSLFVGHVGDSRCYRLRDGVLTLLTRDHSYLQHQIDLGLITPAQAAVSPQRSLVTRALGVEAKALLEVHEHFVEAGDLYLLCSDGLNEMLSAEEIRTYLLQVGDNAEKATLLVAAANDNGGRDNVSVVLIEACAKETPGLITR